MAMCLIRGLIKSNNSKQIPRVFDYNKVGEEYGEWYKSKPFDIGETVERSISMVAYNDASVCIKIALQNNHGKSNGSLMRCTPIAVWAANLEKL